MGLVWDLLAPGYGLLPLFIFPYLHYHFFSVTSLIKEEFDYCKRE